MDFVKSEIISLKNHPEYNEKWLQARIEEDPSIVGIDGVEFRHTEKMLVNGGRLDTILYNPEDKRRYEVEIQLGKTDESHIIRTIEYWDLEQKRNPQYKHCAVIIAEEITGRFLNVISLFNGHIPLIAIQVKAIKIGNTISLFFTRVLDEVKFDLLEEDVASEPADKNYWEKRSKESLKIIEHLLKKLDDVIEGYKLKFNKHYIGIEKNGLAKNFIYFYPRKNSVLMNFKLEKTEEIDELLEKSDLDTLAYDTQYELYRIRIKETDLSSNLDVIKIMTDKAKNSYRNS